MNYKEKLKDQWWVDRSKEIKKRDHHTCQRCGTQTHLLNVHHKYYMPNTDPWDYPDEALITWCRKCHKEQTIYDILSELNSLFIERMLVYKTNINYKDVTTKSLQLKYNQLSNDIAKLREKLRKIEK